ncbi:MAG: ArgE/DapE family deacylase [Verrucomicrobia bacterium]|nr:ArgE/DapE family deacylase [Verrucomicrobiota bacterium]
MVPLQKPQIEKLLCDLIRIPSVNPHLTEDKESNEMNLALFVRDWLISHTIKAHIEEVEPGRPNVYAEIGDGDGKTLCFCAHLDTVGVQEMTIPPFEPTIEDKRMYGRGSCDMKGGLAAVLSAAAALATTGVKGKLILALVCDEEYASIGADDFVKRHRADGCILTEPSDLKIVMAHKGFLWAKVTVPGKSAHGSRWDIGESAISKMGSILVALDEFDKKVLRQRSDSLVGPASMHVSLINGGSGISTYASSCTVHIERRTLPSEERHEVQEEIERKIHKACPDAEIEWYFHRPSMYCDPEEPIAKSVKTAFQEVLGREGECSGFGVWTDAAIFQQAGIPTVNIGPIGFGLHEPVEWVDIDSVVQTASILFHAANSFTNSS